MIFTVPKRGATMHAQARMKYLVHEWGVPKFRSVVEQYFGKKFQPFKCAPLASC